MVQVLMWWLGGRESSLCFGREFHVSPSSMERCLQLCCLWRGMDTTFPHQTHDKCVVYYKIQMLFLCRLSKCLRCTGALTGQGSCRAAKVDKTLSSVFTNRSGNKI